MDSLRHAGDGVGPVRVLEAGCGRRWPFRADDVAMRITGVDINADALRIRREDIGDLDEAIVGDLSTVDLPEASFDAVYCSFVLEHVRDADLVLDRMRAALRPGGRLIIRVPDGRSVYGFLVRHSPHRAHLLYRRYVERFPQAGQPGHGPFPTVYEPVVSAPGLRAWANRHGDDILVEYATDFYLDTFGTFRPLAAMALNLIARLSGGKLSAQHNNIGFVVARRT